MSMTVAKITAAPGLYTLPRDLNEVRRLVIDLAIYARDLEDQVASALKAASASISSSAGPSRSVASSSKSPASISANDSDEDDIDSITYLTSRLTCLAAEAPDYAGIGAFNPLRLLQNTWNAGQRFYGTKNRLDDTLGAVERQHFWTQFSWLKSSQLPLKDLEFPKRDLLLDLCNLYFRHVAPFYPFIHRPTFMKSLSDGIYLSNRKFGALVLSVCACASKYSNDPRVLADGTHQLGWRWYEQIQPVHKIFFETPVLEELQVFCNCLLYLQPFSPGVMWYTLGHAIRIVQELGINNRLWYERSNRSPVEREQWKRVFWFLVISDVIQSHLLGRPRGMLPDDYDLDFPAECDDEYWVTSNPDDAFKQPPEKISKMTFWIWFVKLQNILGYAQRTIHAAKRPEILEDNDVNWRKMAVIRINILLDNWIKCLPDHLRRNTEIEDPVLLEQSAMLHLAYNWVQMEVHRPFIALLGKPLSPPEYSSLAACVKAARSCMQIARENLRNGGLMTLLPIILFNASAILLQDLWGGKTLNPKLIADTTEFQEVLQCIEMLGTCEERWQLAGRVRDVIVALTSFAKSEAVLHTSPESEYTHLPPQGMWNPDGKGSFESSGARHAGNSAEFSEFLAHTQMFGDPNDSPESKTSTPYELPANPGMFASSSDNAMSYLASLAQFNEDDIAVSNQTMLHQDSQITNLYPTWFQDATTYNKWQEWNMSETLYHPSLHSSDSTFNTQPYINDTSSQLHGA